MVNSCADQRKNQNIFALETNGQLGVHQFIYPFFITRNLWPQFESVIAQLVKPYVGLSNQFLVSYSLKLMDHVLVSTKTTPTSFSPNNDDMKFLFDHYYIPNLKHLDWVKVEFIYSIQTIDHKSSCFDVKQKRKFELQFGHLQAYIRCLIARFELKKVNDNFLNFTGAKIDFNDALARLKQYASVNSKVNDLVKCINSQLSKYKSSNAFCLSFNGGKDCTVLLHTLATLYYTSDLSKSGERGLLNLLLIKTSESFDEQELYVKRVSTYYGSKLVTYSGKDLKSSLHVVKNEQPFTTIFMGVRRSDMPESVAHKLSILQPTDTDRGWPEFLRVSPLLDWNYNDIWNFLLHLNVPYCSLYDYGYTSIDYPSNTIPNPSLKIEQCKHLKTIDSSSVGNSILPINKASLSSKPHEDKSDVYLAAYLLDQGSMERCCRVSTK